MSRITSSILAGTIALSTFLVGLSNARAAVGADLPGVEPSRQLVQRPAPKDQLGPAGDTEPTRAPESLTLGGRAFIAPSLGVGAMGWGLDETYSVIPNLAIGGQYLSYVVDQGADPQHCERCITDGKSALVFAEGRLWPHRFFTPYARVGGGLSFVNGNRVSGETGYGETDATLLAEGGVELHHRWFSSRVFGFQLATLGSKLDRDAFRGVGVQLGARF